MVDLLTANSMAAVRMEGSFGTGGKAAVIDPRQDGGADAVREGGGCNCHVIRTSTVTVS
jgi:hypothetical protein